MLVAHVGKLQRIQIYPTGEVETPSSPIRRQNSGREHPSGIARQPDAMAVHIRVQMAAAGCKWRQPGATWRQPGIKWRQQGVGCPPMVYPDSLSGYTPCMDSKQLSSISDCFDDQQAIKTPKLNTFFIIIDCKGP